jgi:hypothetical protein
MTVGRRGSIAVVVGSVTLAVFTSVALGAVMPAASTQGAAVSPGTVIYPFRIAVSGRFLYSDSFEPTAPSPGRCEPVTGLSSTLVFNRPASTGPRADQYYVLPRPIKGFIAENYARHRKTTATITYTNTYGQPLPNCTDTAPPPDCSSTPKPLNNMQGDAGLFRGKLEVGVYPGLTRNPFKTCLTEEASLEAGGRLSSARVAADVKNPHLRRFTFTGSGSDYGTFTWKVTFTRMRCNFVPGSGLQQACLRGER